MRRSTLRLATACLTLGLLAASIPGVLRAATEAVDGGIRFSYTDEFAASVSVAGEFNAWNASANPMTKSGDTWSVVVDLGPGEHEYKFVIDGQWVADPDNPITRGDFGNSVITVTADGSIKAEAARPTLAYNPKIGVGGRVISTFITRDEEDGLRLRRPDFDFDLDFDIAISQLLDARLLTNIRNEAENVEFFQTRLNLDRGYLRFKNERLQLTVYENEEMVRFDDPLRLLGDIGIYDHAFGLDTQGLQLLLENEHGTFELVYADDFAPGGTTGATIDLASSVEDIVAGASGIDELNSAQYTFTDTDNDKDVLAARAKTTWRGWRIGASGRLDRGYNPGAFLSTEGLTDTSLVATIAPLTIEEWAAGGIDLQGEVLPGLTFTGEYLRGRATANPQDESRVTFEGALEVAREETSLDDLEIDTSDKAYLGLDWQPNELTNVRAAYTLETHEIRPIPGQSRVLDNLLNEFTIGADLATETFLDRRWDVGCDITFHDFRYTRGTPWNHQFWFDFRNFWLEQNEHELTVDRITMLGGDDVVTIEPRFEVPLWKARDLQFRYEGTINTIDLSTTPKFVESLFQFTYPLSPRLQLYSDTRWARYDDPVLQIEDDFVSTFLEAKYSFSPAVEVALSWGVDPFAIDEPTNEYDEIGRDLFLFQRGADGTTARDNFFGLIDILPLAEQELEDEKRIQVEAIVRF